jgi:hypothetical protein
MRVADAPLIALYALGAPCMRWRDRDVGVHLSPDDVAWPARMQRTTA